MKCYVACEKLEKMPEQGDWKVADDFVIILDEYLEEKWAQARTTDIEIKRLLVC